MLPAASCTGPSRRTSSSEILPLLFDLKVVQWLAVKNSSAPYNNSHDKHRCA
jgi:hypothetical protein